MPSIINIPKKAVPLVAGGKTAGPRLRKESVMTNGDHQFPLSPQEEEMLV